MQGLLHVEDVKSNSKKWQGLMEVEINCVHNFKGFWIRGSRIFEVRLHTVCRDGVCADSLPHL